MWHFIIVSSIHFHHLNHVALHAQKDIVSPLIWKWCYINCLLCKKNNSKLMPCHFFCFVEFSDIQYICVLSKLGLSFRNNIILSLIWNKGSISYQLSDCAMKFVTRDYNNNKGSKAMCRLYTKNAYVDMICWFLRITSSGTLLRCRKLYCAEDITRVKDTLNTAAISWYMLTPKRPGRHFVAFGWVQRAVEHTKIAIFIRKRDVKLGWRVVHILHLSKLSCKWLCTSRSQLCNKNKSPCSIF